MNDFQDKVVVITGAASGIGWATARAFARRGARVHLADIEERVKERAAELPGPGTGRGHVVDVTDPAAVQSLADAVYAEEGRVDILHNNAGVCKSGPVERTSLTDWHWVMSINLWGVIHGVHAFVPRMIEQGHGHIVNTASMAGLLPFPWVAAYCASKFAVVGLSEALAAELSLRNIHVTVFCPGMVRTELFRNARFDLPGRGNSIVGKAMDQHGRDPDRVAQEILDAVRKKKTLAVSGWGMVALQAVQRVSREAYAAVARLMANKGNSL